MGHVIGRQKKGLNQAIADIRDAQASIIQGGEVIAGGAGRAADIVQATVDENIRFIKVQNARAEGFIQPFFQAGLKGLNAFEDLTGLNGPDAERTAVENIIQGPSVQNAIDLGIKMLDRSNSAKGLSRSGNAAVELQQFGEQTAFGFINDRQNALFNLSEAGRAAAGDLANLATQLGRDVSQQNLFGADARANSEIVGSTARANALTSSATLGLTASPFKRALVDPAFALQMSFGGGAGGGGGGGASFGAQGAAAGSLGGSFQGFNGIFSGAPFQNGTQVGPQIGFPVPAGSPFNVNGGAPVTGLGAGANGATGGF